MLKKYLTKTLTYDFWQDKMRVFKRRENGKKYGNQGKGFINLF